MFEIHKRHAPMFVTSEICRLGDNLKDAFGFSVFGPDLLPIHHTARINEFNSFIVQGGNNGSFETLEAWRTKAQVNITLDGTLTAMSKHYGWDSYLRLTSGMIELPPPWSVATSSSTHPLLVIDSPKPLDFSGIPPERRMGNHWVLWLGEGLVADMSEAESFFAVMPDLKLEVGLNRFEPLARLGDFAIGLIRL